MDVARARSEAREAWDALEASCVERGRRATRVLEGPGGSPAPAWPLGQVLAAAIDVAALDRSAADPERYVRALRPYTSGDGFAPMPGARRRYYDDNAWIGLAFVQLHLASGESRYLGRARRVFGFVRSGLDRRGGVRWVEGRRGRHTCSTAAAAELALRLHLIDDDADALAFGTSALEWLASTLRLRSGLYADHVDPHGRIDRSVFSYNQGATAGAFTLRFRAAADRGALRRAGGVADASLRRFDQARTWRHAPIFNAVWLRNLLALDAVASVNGLGAALDAYLERTVREARDPHTGLFTAGGIGSYDGAPTIDHAGLVQLLALRAWPPEQLLDVC